MLSSPLLQKLLLWLTIAAIAAVLAGAVVAF
jgi:uncharacterized protein involved in exopolysaccharide biosynthesis